MSGSKEDAMAETSTLKIDGMSCQHCVMRVRKAVDELPGVSQADVNIGSARVTYDESKIKVADLERAIEKAGYKVAKA
jgi:copper ion binding protein